MKKAILSWCWPLIRRIKKIRAGYLPEIYERRLLNFYKHKSAESNFTGIIFMQDNHFSKGGLVDRIKGLVSAYFIAQYFHLDFRVYFEDTDDKLINILDKQKLQLILNKNELSFSGRDSRPVVWYNQAPKNLLLIKQKLSKAKQIHLYCNMNLISLFHNQDINAQLEWSSIFKSIIDLSSYSLNPVVKSLFPIKMVGVHLRFIGLLGDFKDLRIHAIEESEKKLMLEWCIHQIQIIGKRHESDKLLVVSDSAFFLKMLQKDALKFDLENRLFIQSDAIGHSALEKTEAVFNKAITDFKALSHCNYVYQLRYRKMHNSDFSRYAAMVNLNSFELIEPYAEN